MHGKKKVLKKIDTTHFHFEAQIEKGFASGIILIKLFI